MNDLDMEIRPLSGALSARSAALEGIYDQADHSSNVALREEGENGVAATTASDPSTLRYDSFRYVYKPDFGRVVLLDQDPMTGDPISQIPSQRVLELYAEQRRNEAKSVHEATAAAASVTSKRRMASSQSAPVIAPTTVSGTAHMAIAPASIASVTSVKPVNITI